MLKDKILKYQKKYESGLITSLDISYDLNCSNSYVNEILNLKRRLQKEKEFKKKLTNENFYINMGEFIAATDKQQENNLKILELYTQKDNILIMSRPLEVGDIIFDLK